MDSNTISAQETSVPRPAARRTVPRLGAFVTIAASLLLLFGAASRIGKIPETAALFGIDRQAENRIRLEEERQRTAVMIGSVPVRKDDLLPPQGAIRLDPDATPPSRGALGNDDLKNPAGAGNGVDSTITLSMPQPFDGDSLSGEEEDQAPRFDDPSLAGMSHPVPERPKTYKVKNGDTWVKVAKHTLGDPKRWRELLNANPVAKDGLRVGMELAIPDSL